MRAFHSSTPSKRMRARQVLVESESDANSEVSSNQESAFVVTALSRSPPKRTRHPSESAQSTTSSDDIRLQGSVKMRAALLESKMRGQSSTSSQSEDSY